MNAGEYEELVEKVVRDLAKEQGVQVYRLREYIGRRSGRKITIDVSFETQLLGAKVLIFVECKHHKRAVEAGDVEKFIVQMQDIGAHKGIVVTTMGYQSGAIKVAEANGVALAILREGRGQEELVYVRKGLARQPTLTSEVMRGNFRPSGRFSGPRYSAGFRVESVDEMLALLALSLDEGEIRSLQERA